jgi:hypothetical protein
MGIDADESMAVFSARDGVDTVRAGDGVIYHQRLSAQRTKSDRGNACPSHDDGPQLADDTGVARAHAQTRPLRPISRFDADL